MKSQAIGLKVASAVFMLAALGHLVRMAMGWKIVIDTCALPMWLSIVAVVVAGALSVWLWTLAGGKKAEEAPAAPAAKPQA